MEPRVAGPAAAAATIGPYEIVRKLGAGGMGQVFLARHAVLGREVVVKQILPALATYPAAVARFIVEAQAAARLAHRHVVVIHDCQTDAHGVPYLVLEYLRGCSVAEWLERWQRRAASGAPKPVSPGLVLVVLAQAAAGIAHAHAHGIIHRDIKPDNLFLTAAPAEDAARLAAAGLRTDLHIKVLDFGIAKLAEGLGAGTGTGLAVGTPAYMSPEQLKDAKHIDLRADIYSLGVVAYQLLTGGTLPWGDSSPVTIYERQSLEPAPDPRVGAPDLPRELSDVVRRSMARQLDARWATIGDFIRAFAAATPAADGLPDGMRILAAYAPELLTASPAPAPLAGPATDALPPGVIAAAAMPTTLGSSAHPRALVPPGRPRRGLIVALGAATVAGVVVAIVLASSGGTTPPSGAAQAAAGTAVDGGVETDASALDAATLAPPPVDAATPIDAGPAADAAPRRRTTSPPPRDGAGSGSTRGYRDVLKP
ncbi:MAG: serine/threonine protein kinase [Myxococcales bacterium]|nr:serine/threonine protein kinase [Myxococcales bacterium]